LIKSFFFVLCTSKLILSRSVVFFGLRMFTTYITCAISPKEKCDLGSGDIFLHFQSRLILLTTKKILTLQVMFLRDM
jgi:hypothetical protein